MPRDQLDCSECRRIVKRLVFEQDWDAHIQCKECDAVLYLVDPTFEEDGS